MQRLAGNFLVNRVVMLHIGNGNISELYELPNGQWQFGKDRNATVVQRVEQVFKLPGQSRWANPQDFGAGYYTVTGRDAEDHLVEEFHEFGELGDVAVLRSVEAWIAKVKARASLPVPMQAGPHANVESDSPHARLHKRIENMSPEVVARLMLAIESTLGPVDDSMNQAGPANHYSEGYGDADNPAPGNTEAVGFRLPDGAKWAQEGNPGAGYLTSLGAADEKGHPIMQWHPTPDFLDMTERPDTGSSLDTVPLKVHDPNLDQELAAERDKHPELAATGSRRTAKPAVRNRR